MGDSPFPTTWADIGTVRSESMPADAEAAAFTIASALLLANPWHDERGRFAPKGTGRKGSGGRVVVERDAQGRVVVTDEARLLAADVHGRAVAVEPAISKRLAELAGDDDPETYDPAADGEMYGFEFRLKAEDKIAEKIMRNIEEKGLDYEGAADSIKDAVRYTVHFPEGDFGPSAQAIVDGLRADGLEVTVKNTWPPEAGSAYKGVNVSVKQPDGLRYEVQFHTPNSQAVKDKMHTLYEEQRVLDRSSPRWQQLESEMLTMVATLPTPTGATEVYTVST